MEQKINEIEVNGVAYVPKGTQQKELSGDIRIVILQRGWVMVGRWSKSGSQCFLDNASVIRVWGTTKGLGELVNEPLKDTKLDPCGHAEFHEYSVIATLNCNKEGWKRYV